MSSAKSDVSWSTRASFLAFPIITGFAQVGLLPILPQITQHFGNMANAGVVVRFLVTGVGLAMIFGAPFAGLVSKKFGWRRSLVGAVLTFCLAGAAGAVVGDLWGIVITRLLVGLSVAVLGALIMAILTLSLDGGERDRWIGFVVVSGTLGSLVLIPLSGFIGSIDWRLPFLFHLTGLAALFAILPGIKEPSAAAEHREEEVVHSASGFPFWAAGLGLLIGILVHAQSTFVPFHLANIGITNPRFISIAMVVGIPAIAAVSFFYGTFRRYVSMKAIFVVSSVACAIGFLTVGLADTLPVAICGNVVLGIGGGLLSPNMFAFAASRSSPSDRARDIGIVRGAFSAGPFIGQIGLEPIAAMESAGIAVASLCVVAVFAALIFATIIKGGARAVPA